MSFTFEPDRVAQFEAAGWRAYYERAWLKLLYLIIALSQEQFHIPFPISCLAAYFIVRASILWAPREHDLGAVRSLLERYYRLARRYSHLEFDPARAAALEVEYWDVHRRLSGQLDKAEFVRTLTGLHGLIFNLTPDQARESAEARVLANNIVDGITSQASLDVKHDWVRIEAALRQCYRSIARQVALQPPTQTAHAQTR